MTRTLFICALLAAAAGCAKSGGELRKRGEEAKRLLDSTRVSAPAKLSFAAISEGGGTVVTYLKSALPQGQAFTCYELGAPAKPDCLYFKPGAAEGEIVIEGYGEKLDKPEFTLQAFLDPKLRPGWAAAEQAAGSQAGAATPGDSQAGQAQQGPYIESMHMQWIVSDSKRKLEIILLGLNMTNDAAVTSASPYFQVDRVEPDPARTSVIVSVSPDAPAGSYEFQYQATGFPAIPFTIQYTR